MVTSNDIRLSPSSINTYFRSPRLFYYQYILKIKPSYNIHLYKGNFVHKTLENFFEGSRFVDPKDYFDQRMTEWNIPSILKKELSEEEQEFHREETKKMFSSFRTHMLNKIDMILMEGKVKDKNHAWNYIKPRFKEKRIFDKNLNILGIIDSIEQDFDENTFIIDYKTSKLYKHTVPEDYIRQVSIYAYLFRQEFGRIPQYAGIHYLRYGEVFLVPVNEDLVNKAIDDIKYVRKNIQSRNIDDYPTGDDKWALRDIKEIEEKIKKNG